MNRYAYSPAQREELEQLISDLYLNQKKSVREIAKITGYTYEHIRKLLIKLGIYSSLFFSSEKPTSLTLENRPPSQFEH